MKKWFVFIVMFSFAVSLFAQSEYYWYRGRKIALETLPGKKFVLFDSPEDTVSFKKMMRTESAKIRGFEKTRVASKLNPYSKRAQVKEKQWTVVEDKLSVKSRSFSSSKEVLYEAPFFLTKNNVIAGLSHLFYVKLNKAEDLGKLETMAQENKVEILGNDQFMPLWYTLACSKVSLGNALQMANVFYESGLFSAAEPDLMAPAQHDCANDTYFSDQWNLSDSTGFDINFCKASMITKGSSDVVIAVVDEGVLLNHPDLTNMYPVSYDTYSSTPTNPLPSVTYESHGTRCAGIIGADANNNRGVAGIAPDCPIMSISVNFQAYDDEWGAYPSVHKDFAEGINFAWKNGASVISNSWHVLIEFQQIEEAIDSALTRGRNGLGCVVVFAAGNSDRDSVTYPANCDDRIITVGAINTCGQRKMGYAEPACDDETWGSCYGPKLDVVAPGIKIPTTDWKGDYKMDFNGTSSACPHVAAIAGLILSLRPDFTVRQVSDVIEFTARKLDFYEPDYAVVPGRPNGTWEPETGYGLVDAYRALRIATVCNENDYINKTITANTSLHGCKVNMQNISIQNNAKLMVGIEKEANIKGPFDMQNGTQFELKYEWKVPGTN